MNENKKKVKKIELSTNDHKVSSDLLSQVTNSGPKKKDLDWWHQKIYKKK